MKKRILCVICICVLVILAAVLPASAAQGDGFYLRGDTDRDGKITILDATLIRLKIADMEVPFMDELAADVDDDGLSILDATEIQRYLVKLKTHEAIGELVVIPGETTPLPTDAYELPFIPA